MSRPRGVLELFSGVGGAAEAARGVLRVVGAVDHDRRAMDVYAAHFPDHPRFVKNLASVKTSWLGAFEADVWWLSPPCAPHSVRGRHRDLSDPRSAGLRRVLDAVREVRPPAVFLENVPGFEGSDAERLVFDALDAGGLAHVVTREICPTELGIPGVRRRYYLVASRTPVVPTPTPRVAHPLAAVLDPGDAAELDVPEDVASRFGGALHVVDADDPEAIAACFTRAYGRSPVYCGSYLRRAGRLRRFSPAEIARLHGHTATHALAALPPALGWKLVGNGLSVHVVRWLFSWLPAS